MWSQPVRKHGCGERDVALAAWNGRSKDGATHHRILLCAGDHGVAHVEREQKKDENLAE